MKSRVAVIDYGIGNVFSVCNALSRIGASPELTRDASAIMQADRVILPGVGAFGRAMDALRDFGLDEVLHRYVESGKPLLGICIGMQVLMERSFEFGENSGLGFIPGDVVLIPRTSPDGVDLRIPHIAWQPLQPSGHGWNASALAGIGANESFYFVHSFHAKAKNPEDVIATANYSGVMVTAAVQKNNVTGVQFHPERSGPAGLKILARFAN